MTPIRSPHMNVRLLSLSGVVDRLELLGYRIEHVEVSASQRSPVITVEPTRACELIDAQRIAERVGHVVTHHMEARFDGCLVRWRPQ